MNIFLDKHLLLIQNLIKGDVSFILIGGYAVNFHGYNRTTGDMDLWVKPANENRDKMIKVLFEMGFNKDDLDTIGKMDFTKALAFNFWEIPYKVDVLTKVAGVDYETADKEKIIAEVENVKIPFIHVNHLVLSKIGNNRTKDKLDVEELQKIQSFKK
jgi:hypothetical protein